MKENLRLDDQPSKPKRNQWLSEFASNVTSQTGEDGIIDKVLEVINDRTKWCVEFGCWDGKHLSNTYNLVKNNGYSAVLIEGDAQKFDELLQMYEGNDKVIAINAYVGFDKENCLDRLLETTDIPVDFDVLSVDIDGNDYHVWEASRGYKPRVVVIEFNPTIPKMVEFVQPRDRRVTQGSSLLSITKLARAKGYELVSATISNAIYVDSKYFGLFGIKDNSIEAIWTDQSLITHIFSGYDGTVFIRGCCKLPWHNISCRESRMQQLPGFLRKGLVGRGKFRKLRKRFLRLYRHLREKNIV